MDEGIAAALHRLTDESEICACINRNALGSDILDEEMWKATYWPDALEDHEWYQGNAHEFVAQVVVSLRTDMDSTSHHISNIMVEVTGDQASAISYFLSYCRIVGEDGVRRDAISGGRYIDTFERRDSVWKIRERITKADWIRMFDDSLAWGEEIRPGYAPRLGSRDPQDPVRVLLGLNS